MIIFLLSLLYFATRLPFIRTYPVFYDSFEYVRIIEKLNWNNITPVISSAHQTIHTFYFITCLVFKSIFFRASTELSMLLISLLFGYATCIVWYLLIKKIINKEVALFSTIILILFPYFFIANTNILYEAELIFFQILSFYLLYIGVERKKYATIIISGIMLGFAHLIFVGTLIVLPLYFYLLLLKYRKKRFNFILYSALYLGGFSISGVILDLLILQSIPTLIAKYISHMGDIVSYNQGLFVFIARIVRNCFIQTSAILSYGGAALLFVSIIIILALSKKKRLMFAAITVVFIPFIVLMQYWYGGFFGRLAIGIIFPAAFIIATTFSQTRVQIIKIIILLLFFIWIPWRQLDPPPLYTSYYMIWNEKSIFVITSDYNRFLYEKNAVPHFTIKGDTAREEIKKYIDLNLKNKTVLIDSSALRYPYFQYDGSGYNVMSVRSDGTPLIGSLLDSYTYKEFKKEPFSDVFFLRILSKKK